MFILHRYTHTYITKHPTNYSLGAERFNLKLCSSTLEPTRGVFLMKWELISPLLPQREAKIEAAVRHLILTMSIWPYNFWQLGSVERNTYRVGRCVGSFTILQTEKKIRSQWSMILPSNQSCRCISWKCNLQRLPVHSKYEVPWKVSSFPGFDRTWAFSCRTLQQRQDKHEKGPVQGEPDRCIDPSRKN